ncbi:MAG: hypothetical protein ACREAS_05370 [Nitrososphaera sp.]
MVVQRFRITQDPVATYYDNYKEEQSVRLYPAPPQIPQSEIEPIERA